MELPKYAANAFSLSGEDGIIAEILRRLGLDSAETDHWCVEFGAWDGVYLSNTFNLVRNYGWNAIYIESDGAKFTDLRRLALRYPHITPIWAMVSADPKSASSFDALLSAHPLARDFSLLSIDIDANDLEVWESIANYHPIVVVVEVDSSLGADIDSRFSTTGGTNSFAAALKVGQAKGYTPVCHTGNVIFVRSDLAGRVLGDDAEPQSVRFDYRWMRPPSFVSKVCSWSRYRFYLAKKQIRWNP